MLGRWNRSTDTLCSYLSQVNSIDLMRFELPLTSPTGAADALSTVRALLRADPLYHDPIYELVVSIPEGDGFPEADHLSNPTQHAEPLKTRALIDCPICYSEKCKATAPWYSMTQKFGRVPQVRALAVHSSVQRVSVACGAIK